MQTEFFKSSTFHLWYWQVTELFVWGWEVHGVNTSCLPPPHCICSLSSSGSSVSQEAGLHGLHQQILLPSGWGQPSRRQRKRVTQDIYSHSSLPVGPHCTGFIPLPTWLSSAGVSALLASKAFGDMIMDLLWPAPSHKTYNTLPVRILHLGGGEDEWAQSQWMPVHEQFHVSVPTSDTHEQISAQGASGRLLATPLFTRAKN